MKCQACGYIYDRNFNFETKEDNKIGDAEFISLDQIFTYETEGNWHRITEKAYLYVCPKCKTVRMGD